MEEHKTNIQLSNIIELGKKIPKITVDDDNDGSGFFIRIPYYKGKFKKVLITNNHILTYDIQKAQKSFKIVLNEKEERDSNTPGTIEERSIKLDKSERFIFSISNKKEDFTIVEILDKDNIPNSLFLDYDQEYLKQGYQTYLGKEIVVFQHPRGKPICYAQGKFVGRDSLPFEFSHSAPTDYGSSGSPIILKENLKVIGLHTGGGGEYNYATFFGVIIDKVNAETKNYEDHRTFIGRVINNQANGYGGMEYPNGLKYYGDFKDDLPHGKIRIKKKIKFEGKEQKKTIFIGEFVKGVKEGKGVNFNKENFI